MFGPPLLFRHRIATSIIGQEEHIGRFGETESVDLIEHSPDHFIHIVGHRRELRHGMLPAFGAGSLGFERFLPIENVQMHRVVRNLHEEGTVRR